MRFFCGHDVVQMKSLTSIMMTGLMIGLLALSGCGSEARWTRANLFSTTEAARSQHVVAAKIVSVAFLGGVQRGLNLKLDEAVKTEHDAIHLPGTAGAVANRHHADAASSRAFRSCW